MNDARSLSRRNLIGLTGAAIVAGCANAAPAKTSTQSARVALADWAAIRAQFPTARDKVQLGGMLFTSHPTPVREAIARHRRDLDDDPVGVIEREMTTRERTDRVLASAARYLGGPPDQIALTDSTTAGIGLVYTGLALRAGDEIVTTDRDFFATHEALRLAAERSGAVVRTVPLYARGADADAASIVRAIERAVGPKTRAVAITYVHSWTGVKMPLRAIADVVQKANAGRAPDERVLVCVDGVHGFGVEDVTMEDLGCDFFMAGCHKWLFGPRGTGIVWGRADAWSRLRPVVPPFYKAYIWPREFGVGSAAPPSARVMTPGGFAAFEHRWALGEAFDFHMEIGKARVAARIHEHTRALKRGLAAMRNVTVHTPMDDALSAGIVCFEISGLAPRDVVARLLDKGIVATTTPYEPPLARFSPGLLNDEGDLERALRATREIAGA